MSAQILEIDAHLQSGTYGPPRLSDFDYHLGEHIPAETVVADPNISLFCLDNENRRAIFVSTPSEIDLAEAPFVYLTQRDHAHHLVALPYHELFQITDQMRSQVHPIFIYTVGRSGSTLLSQVFNRIGGVLSLSEPDMLTSCMLMREPNGSQDREIIRLIRSCILMACKPQGCRAYAIKWRDWTIHIADLIYAAFPHAHNIFLYRDAERWANSWYRLYTQVGIAFEALPEQEDGFWSSAVSFNPSILRFLPQVYGQATIRDTLFVVGWLSTMDRYLKLIQQNIPFLAVRYEDLNTHREPVLKAIFDYCGVSASQVKVALGAFSRDAQQGTPLEDTSQQEDAEQIALNAEQVEKLRAILQKHDTINTPDFTLPGTLEM